jgi:hypothetical protein
MTEPFGLSHEMLVRGLVCLKFITPRADMCRINQDAWKAFRTTYMLGDLFELEPASLLGGKRQYYVKMGRDCRQNGSKCIDGVKDKSLRMRRRICSDGRKRKVFVETLLDLIASEWDDEEMNAWLTSGAKQVDQSNKKGDNNESDRESDKSNESDRESDKSTRTGASSPKSTDDSTGTASPPKDGSHSTAITPNALSNSELKATLVPPIAFLKLGKSAEKEAFPFLHAFDIPIDNDDTLHGLFRDLQKRLRTSEHTTGIPLPSEGFVYQTINSKPELMIPISKASSRSGQDKFVATVSSALTWATSDVVNKESEAETVKAVLGFLGENYSEIFVEKKMDAITAAAMAEQANINTTGMRVIARFLRRLFGYSILPTQCQLRAVGDQYFKATTFAERINGNSIDYWYKDIDHVLKHMANEASAFEDVKDLERLDMSLGGDHGQGAFSFMALLALRYKKESGKESKYFAVQIGQIESAADSSEILKPLVDRLEAGLLRMYPDKEGNVQFKIVKGADMKSELIFIKPTTVQSESDPAATASESDPAATAAGDPVNEVCNSTIQLYIAGDLKFEFTMAGRDGHASSSCLWCKLTKKEWIEIHDKGSAELGDPWLLDELFSINAHAQLRESNNEDGDMQGVKENPFWSFIPIGRYLFPLLHDLLGLGNNVIEYVWETLLERWEPQSEEFKAVFDRCLMAEKELNKSVEAAKAWKETDAVTLEALAVESKNLTQAMKQRGLTDNERDAHAADRAKMTETMSELRKGRDKRKKKVKRNRKIFRELSKAQKAARKNIGRSERRLKAEIEEDVLHPLKIDSSAYHGGALAGNAIRRLMEHAETVAEGVGSRLRQCNLVGREQEIEDFTSGIKVVLLLLDAIYSLLMTKYGKVTDEILDKLAKLLELLRVQWVYMQLPMTPKFHSLLRHAVSQLKSTGGGLCDMGEDGIERSHQERLKDHRRFAGLKDFQRRTDSQSKMQYIRMMPEVKKTQEEVAVGSMRILKRARPLVEERKEMSLSVREEKRSRAAQEATDKPITKPQATARQLNMADVSQGKTIQRAKP